MIARAIEIAEARGTAAADGVAERLAEAIRAAAQGARVTRDGGIVTAERHGLLRDPALVWPAGLVR